MIRQAVAAAAAFCSAKVGQQLGSTRCLAWGSANLKKGAPFKATVRQLAEQASKEGGEGPQEAGSWVKDFAQSKLRLLLAAGLGIVLLNAGASAAFDWYYHKSVLDTLMAGVLPPPQAPPVLPRTELYSKVRDLLQPKEPSAFYHIITGPPGGGKSTLVRQACSEVGRGVGYLDVPPAFEVDFGRDLGNAFNFRFQEHMTRLNIVSKPVLGTEYSDPRNKHPLASVRQSAEALHDAAVEFRQKTGRPFVLVIDSADRLASSEEGERVLGALRAYARDWAQEGTVTTIFIAHHWGSVEKLIGDHPAQSRAAPVLRVPDVSQQEAVQYLGHLQVDPKMANKCASLAGGSLLLLQRCASMAKAGAPFPEVKSALFDLIELAYQAAGLLDRSPQQQGGLQVVEALLSSGSGSISASEWRDKVPEREHKDGLLGKGVLRFDGRQVTFSSNLAAAYAAEQLGSRLPSDVQKQHKQLKKPGWW